MKTAPILHVQVPQREPLPVGLTLVVTAIAAVGIALTVILLLRRKPTTQPVITPQKVDPPQHPKEVLGKVAALGKYPEYRKYLIKAKEDQIPILCAIFDGTPIVDLGIDHFNLLIFSALLDARDEFSEIFCLVQHLNLDNIYPFHSVCRQILEQADAKKKNAFMRALCALNLDSPEIKHWIHNLGFAWQLDLEEDTLKAMNPYFKSDELKWISVEKLIRSGDIAQLDELVNNAKKKHQLLGIGMQVTCPPFILAIQEKQDAIAQYIFRALGKNNPLLGISGSLDLIDKAIKDNTCPELFATHEWQQTYGKVKQQKDERDTFHERCSTVLEWLDENPSEEEQSQFLKKLITDYAMRTLFKLQEADTDKSRAFLSTPVLVNGKKVDPILFALKCEAESEYDDFAKPARTLIEARGHIPTSIWTNHFSFIKRRLSRRFMGRFLLQHIRLSDINEHTAPNMATYVEIAPNDLTCGPGENILHLIPYLLTPENCESVGNLLPENLSDDAIIQNIQLADKRKNNAALLYLKNKYPNVSGKFAKLI